MKGFSLWQGATMHMLIAALLVGLVGGLSVGWVIWSPKKKVTEAYEVAQRNEDKSLVLEKKPQASAKPAHKIPKGAVVERIVQVEVQSPGPSSEVKVITPGSYATDPLAQPSPKRWPIRVDLTLYRQPDGTKRVVASSPDGEVVGGVDIPVEAARPEPKPLKWAAGGVLGTTAWGDKAVGAFIDRDLAFGRVGLEVTQNTYAESGRRAWEARAKVGIRF